MAYLHTWKGPEKRATTRDSVFLKIYCQNLEKQIRPKLDRAGAAPPLYGIAFGYVGRVLGVAERRGTSEIEILTQVQGTFEKIECLRPELRGQSFLDFPFLLEDAFAPQSRIGDSS